MTSPTEKTKSRRKAKKVKCGQKRKNKLRKTGTTPKLFSLESAEYTHCKSSCTSA